MVRSRGFAYQGSCMGSSSLTVLAGLPRNTFCSLCRQRAWPSGFLMAFPSAIINWLSCLCSWNAPGNSLPTRVPLPAPVWHQLQDLLGSQAAAERASSGREAGPSSQSGNGAGLSGHHDNGSSGTSDVWLRIGRQNLLCLQDVPGQPRLERS